MTTSTTKHQPNVIVFFTDQQRWDTTGVHGNPLDLTPNFDRIASYGTHIDTCFTCQPVCGPARSCLQTGLYPTTSGCFVNGIPLQPEHRTLAHYFNDAGYETAYIGKWHLASKDPVQREQRGGYQNWLASNVLEFTSDSYQTRMFDDDCKAVDLPGYRVDALTDAAIRMLDRDRDQPLFLFLSFLEPHYQNHIDSYPAPIGYAERYTGRWTPPDLAALGGSSARHLPGYYGMVKRLDEALGRLQDALISLGQWDDTILLFTSDHGNHFKTRNGEYKRSCHESSIRIPAAIHGPGFEGGGRLRQLVSLVDLPPTILDAAGIAVPAAMQGRSLMPVLRRETTEWPDDMFVQISEAELGRAVRTRRWKYCVTAPDKNPVSDSASSTYVETYLYDLEADPYELDNLVGCASHKTVTSVMRERLARRLAQAGEPAARIVDAPSRPKRFRDVSEAEARA
ncbi:MAG: sulfatase-like hydrolase/transferase [Capsulimonadaceae bacterium]|nr:sulfatase-like hydrolase/transferase [Capsulimonadaceae bacterium]